ncbi:MULTISPECIES: ABC transporter ATP-binding protein [unclassified Frankia]|nr:ABC transporter ATP-binding protein [Frankia sp. ACN1ag]KQC36220.1 hypothetical protein UK82_22430 [Frankia sp. ACN1ag]
MPPPAPPATTVAAAMGLTKVYGYGDGRVLALDRVSVAFGRSEFAAIMGPSGSGKSTLMHCLAGLDRPTSGSVRIGPVELSRMTDRQLTRLRRDRIGFIFQNFHLIPTLTAAENITVPLTIAGRRPDNGWFDAVIRAVGLADRLNHLPSQLSGGQQQRVACARALMGRPDIVFADEPTGNLDSRAGAGILSFLQLCARQFGQTIVMVTHDPVAAAQADRVVFLSDGRIVDELTRPSPDSVLDRIRALDATTGMGYPPRPV